jgi:hypothetical protein
MDDVRPLLKLSNPLAVPPPEEIKELIRRGAMFFCNHSGGKVRNQCFTTFIAMCQLTKLL